MSSPGNSACSDSSSRRAASGQRGLPARSGSAARCCRRRRAGALDDVLVAEHREQLEAGPPAALLDARARRPRDAARGRSGTARTRPVVAGHRVEPLHRRCWPGRRSVTSRHSPAWPPRPTRPRSWWSWETPNRSASRITITVALGTSTPTSITVVATSTSISPAAKACIVRSFSSGGIRPCSISTRSPASCAGRQLGEPAPRRAPQRPGLVVGSIWPARPARRAVDPRAHDVGLAALGDLLAHPLPGTVQPLRLLGQRAPRSSARRPPCRQLDERRGVEVAEDGHRDRARDRRRGHHQHVRRRAGLGAQRGPLLDAEAVLLVDHDQPEVGELHAAPRAGRGCRRRCRPPRRPPRASAVAAGGRVQRPGEQRDPGAALRAAEQAALRRGRRASPRSSGGAAGRAPRSARAAPPGRRRRRPGASRAARRPSCPSRPRPAAAGASGGPAPARRRSPRRRALARR